MKTRIWIPGIILAFSLSSFSVMDTSHERKNNSLATANLTLEEFCPVYDIASIYRSGKDPAPDFYGYMLSFCPDFTFSIRTYWNETYTGQWYQKGEMLVIDVQAPDAIAWINGTWRVVQETGDDILELERWVKEEFWKVILVEKRQR